MQFKFVPRIVRPTRIKKQSASLIDHILTQDNGNCLVSGILSTEIAGNSGFTDHFPTFTVLKADLTNKKKQEPIVRSFFTQQGRQDRRTRLRLETWDNVFEQDDPDTVYDLIAQKYGQHYNETKTTKTYKRGSNRFKREPWMTVGILADIRRRDRLAKIPNRRKDYKKLRNELVSQTRRAEREYINQQVKDNMGNIKKHWDIIRKATNKTNNKEEMTTEFSYKGKMVSDPQTNADNCNEYLANIGKETNASVGKSKKTPIDYLKKHKTRNQNSILLSSVSHYDIIDICKQFKPKTSTDPHGFQQNIILEDVDILAPVLAHLVNCSLKSGVFPRNGKIARVIPVYKGKGEKSEFVNYRPISLLPVFSKIIERLIYNKVFEFLVRYEILFESQYGFRSGHNTTHAALDFISKIEETIEASSYAIGVFCDLSKAFDTLNHDILLDKLEHYGIRGIAQSWFRSYLSNRSQYVDLNGYKSTELPLPTGVPQGSILGPLLFLLYINDLPSASKLKCVIFADDTNLLIQGNDLKLLAETLNKELEIVDDYFKANQLKLNAKKTKVIIFRKKAIPANIEQLNISLNKDKLDICEEVQFLGLTIDGTLCWEKHCNNVANKISRSSSMINRVKKFLPPSTLKLLYHSFIQSHISYGLTAWGGCSAQNKKRIVKTQKRVVRTITKSFFTAHTEPRMKKLALLKFEELYEQQCLLLVHDCVQNKAPPQISILLENRSNNRYNLRGQSTSSTNLKPPIFKTRAGTSSFRVKGPAFWNSAPQDIKNIERKGHFKRELKKILLDRYKHKSNCTNPRCKDKQHHNQG